MPGWGKCAGGVALAVFLAVSVEAGVRARLFFHDPHVWRDGLFQYRPDTQAGDAVSVVTNNRGFFGPDLAVPKPEGRFRVLLLGSSPLTNEAVPAAVAARLSEAAADGVSVEAVSTGLPRYTSWHVLRLLRDELLALEPDVLVLYLGLNDNVYNTNPGLEGEPPAGLWNWADPSTSVVASMLWYHAVQKRMLTRPGFNQTPGARVFERHLRAVLDAAGEAGVPVVLAGMATGWPAEDPVLRAAVQANEGAMAHFWGYTEPALRGLAANTAVMQRLAGEGGAAYCGLPRERLAPASGVFQDLCHLTPAGRQTLGRALGDCVAALECFPAKRSGKVSGGNEMERRR